MLTKIRSSRSALAEVARAFDVAALSGEDAVAVVAELGKIRRLTDGMLAKAAKRVKDTEAPMCGGDRGAEDQLACETGVGSGEGEVGDGHGRGSGETAGDGRGCALR